MRTDILIQGTIYHDLNFSLYSRGQLFQSVGGVYVFLKQTNHKFEILYIGQTENFQDRIDKYLAQHTQINCLEYHDYTHIAALTVRDKLTRLAIETDLINTISPPCNRQG